MDHLFLVISYYIFIHFFFKMVKSESFPKFMWLPLIEFSDYSETVFSTDNRWVFS